MSPWFERLSIRARINLLVLAILLPVAATLAWFLAVDLRHAREAGHAKVRILATTAAAEVERFLRHSEGILGRLATRPLVKALDPGRCDPLIAEFTRIDPQYIALGVRDLHSNIVCANLPDPIAQLDPLEFPWFAAALRRDAFSAGDAILRRRTGRWMSVLSHPIRNDAGATVGLLSLPVELLSLSEQLLASTPKNAVVTVLDRQRAVLLRSAEATAFIGTRPNPATADPLAGQREGVLTSTGREGEPRVIAFVTIAGVDWRVVAGLPEAEVFADYRAILQRTVAIGLGLLLLASWLAWRLNSAIARPVAALARTAAEVAAGDTAARAMIAGPPEIAAVAQQFNRMLDAHDLSSAALSESEQRYRTLVDWSPEAISVHRDGKVLFVNPATVAMLGAKSAQDLVGKSSLDFVHPDSQPVVAELVQSALEQDFAVKRHEEQFIRCDGTLIDVEVQGIPIAYGGAPALFASMRDITARRQTEIALQRSEARLHGIFDSATDAILTVDDAQTIVMANPAAAILFRCPIEALIGAPLQRLLPERHRQQHASDVQAFGASEVRARHMGRLREVVGLRTDGEEFPVDAAISHHAVAGERMYTVVLRDITERQQTAAALRDSEAGLRRLLMLLPEAVFVNSGNRVTLVNAAAQRLFGADEAALLGRPPLELIHPDSVDVVKARIAALRGGATIAPLTEVTILRADGSTRLVESVATLIDSRGDASIAVVMRDVTELRQAQLALARSHADLRRLVAAQDKVQEAERKRIARELHDDLQQTLAAIKLDLSTIGERLAADRASVAPLLDEVDGLVMAAIDSTRRIVNDLRPQMLEDLGLGPALELLASQFSQRTGIACQFEADGRVGDALMASPTVSTCLFRVTQEALNNVAKHAQANSVQIRLASVPDGRVALRVSDNGTGMRAGARRKTDSYGLLGMHERVRTLGGVLRISSQPGVGTAVEVLVPVAGEPTALHDAPRPGLLGEPAAAFTRELAQTLPRSGFGMLEDTPAAHDVHGGATRHPLQGVIDALAGNVAVLDRQGVILLVNRAWREFAEHNGDLGASASGPGVNYLEVCRRSAPDDEVARQTLDGLQALLDGGRAVFEITYPCHAPGAPRWFRLHAAPMVDGTILVTHFDLSAWLDPAKVGEATE